MIEFSHPHEVARTETFVTRLIGGSDLLAHALVRLRDFYTWAASPPLVADGVLAQVETALEMAARAKNGF